MTKFRWVHFTDLHWGSEGQAGRWSGIKEALKEDLSELQEALGGEPWDAIFFTGDITNRGTKKEFISVSACLSDVKNIFNQLGSDPDFFIVPGNHDLVRPKDDDPVFLRMKEQWKNDEKIKKGVFGKKTTDPYFKVIDKAFKNYKQFCEQSIPFRQPDVTSGRIPGDFSCSIEKGPYKIGVTGVNTAFLQLDSDSYKGKLAIDRQQWISICGNDYFDWYRNHDLSVVLSHHPINWLDKVSQENFKAMTPNKHIAMHLCGHMHETQAYKTDKVGLNGVRSIVQSTSLFSHNSYEIVTPNGKFEKRSNRRYGYSAGVIEFNGKKATTRLWARKGKEIEGQFSFIRDDDIHPKSEGGDIIADDLLTRVPSEKHEPIPCDPRISKENQNNDFSSEENLNSIVKKVEKNIEKILKKPELKILCQALLDNIDTLDFLNENKPTIAEFLVSHKNMLDAILLLKNATIIAYEELEDDVDVVWDGVVKILSWLLLLTINDLGNKKFTTWLDRACKTQVKLSLITDVGLNIAFGRMHKESPNIDINKNRQFMTRRQLETGFGKNNNLLQIKQQLWKEVMGPEEKCNVPDLFTALDNRHLNSQIKLRERINDSHYISIKSKDHVLNDEELFKSLINDLPDLRVIYLSFGDDDELCGDEDILMVDEIDLFRHIKDFFEIKPGVS